MEIIPRLTLLAALVNVSTSCQRFLYGDRARFAAADHRRAAYPSPVFSRRWLFRDALDNNDSRLARGVSSRSEFLAGGGRGGGRKDDAYK